MQNRAERGRGAPQTERYAPVDHVSPDTRREAIYANPMLTRFIFGFSAEESHAVLEELFREITRPENDWQAGDLVV